MLAPHLSRILARRSVIVASASVPFSRVPIGPAAALVDAIRGDGRAVHWIEVPVSDRPEDAADQRYAIEALDLRKSCGTLVCIDTPAFLMSHRNKRVWLTDPEARLDPGELAALRAATRVFAASTRHAVALGRDYGMKAAMLAPEMDPADAARRLTA